MSARFQTTIAIISMLMACLAGSFRAQAETAMNSRFEVVEGTIADIHDAIRAKRITSTDLVNMYLARIKAYNGSCVDQPEGIRTRLSHCKRATDQCPNDIESQTGCSQEMGFQRSQRSQHDRCGRQ